MKQILLTICLIVYALPVWGDNLVCKYIVNDLKNGVTFELEKNKKDGKKTSHFEKELKTYLGKYASMLHK